MKLVAIIVKGRFSRASIGQPDRSRLRTPHLHLQGSRIGPLGTFHRPLLYELDFDIFTRSTTFNSARHNLLPCCEAKVVWVEQQGIDRLVAVIGGGRGHLIGGELLMRRVGKPLSQTVFIS